MAKVTDWGKESSGKSFFAVEEVKESKTEVIVKTETSEKGTTTSTTKKTVNRTKFTKESVPDKVKVTKESVPDKPIDWGGEVAGMTFWKIVSVIDKIADIVSRIPF